MIATESALDRCGVDELKRLARECHELFPQVDAEKFVADAQQAIHYYKANGKGREQLRSLQRLERRWYDGYDYSVYDSLDILPDIWACWVVYSRQYLKGITSKVLPRLRDVNSVADLGCGLGYTTAALVEMFPSAKIVGTNLKSSPQWGVCERQSRRGFSLVESIREIENADLVFASEYFEHFQKPIEHLLDILTKLDPKYLIIANAFGTTSIGHFHEYFDNGAKFSGKEISKLFNFTLREMGYKNQKVGLWNNRPAIWSR